MSAKGNNPCKDYVFAEPKVKRIMKALKTLEPNPCPTKCLFSCIITNQSHFYRTTLRAVLPEGLILKGVFQSCLWILGQVLRNEDGPCADVWTLTPAKPNYS